MFSTKSPTVINAYKTQQNWFTKSSNYGDIDKDGYCADGFHHQTGIDRAGNSLKDYQQDLQYFEGAGYHSAKYEETVAMWDFDVEKEMPCIKVVELI